MDFKHISVLLEESVDGLSVNPAGTYVDGTLGGGGHAFLLCSKLANGRLIGIDRDNCAICAAQERLKPFKEKITVVHDNFSNIKNILKNLNVSEIDGAILDLGVSSHQLDTGERGFSYNIDAPLDMRMDRSQNLSAYDVVNTYSEEQLTKIIFDYGEERYAKKIARNIVSYRAESPVGTTFELSEIIKKAMPVSARFGDKHPAKRTFQAIRIEVNGELSMLENAVQDFVDVLRQGGRLAVITFHSLEDRIVKRVFAKMQSGCVCPPDFPVCICNKKPLVKMVNKKPIVADDEALSENRRAHSAKLRIIEKL